MVKSLSAQLADLSVRAKKADDAVAAAQKEAHDKLSALTVRSGSFADISADHRVWPLSATDSNSTLVDLTVKGTRERAGPALCKGYLSQSEIRRSQLLQITGGDCFVDLHTSPIQQGELRRLIGALEFISSESRPLSLPLFNFWRFGSPCLAPRTAVCRSGHRTCPNAVSAICVLTRGYWRL
jgi:hypothetical protein